MADWLKCVNEMGTWYSNNVNSYQHAQSNAVPNRSAYPLTYVCPLINEKIRDDCSGFVVACLKYAGVFSKNQSFNANDFSKSSGTCADLLRKGGFKPIKFDADDLKAGDIYAHSSHVEICAGKNMQWGWGNNNYKKLPSKTGYASPWTSKEYTTIWRLDGADTNTEGMIYNGSLDSTGSSSGSGQSQVNATRPIMASRGSNNVYRLCFSYNNKISKKLSNGRSDSFVDMQKNFSENAPELGRNIILTDNLYGTEVLKGQDAKTFRNNKDKK